MTETRRLYYEDVYKKEFTATVVECRERKKGYAVILDESAFYPEGGGQPSDVGTLGDAKVTEVHEKDGELLHYTDKALRQAASSELRLQELQHRLLRSLLPEVCRSYGHIQPVHMVPETVLQLRRVHLLSCL